jgi:peptidoglycan/xylan/chitin deacetylase (PgdA/CDA1 family)
VYTQTPQELGKDLRAARATIERLTGRQPLGYRAPIFSITPAVRWAFEVLAAEGFAYDSSQLDSPRTRGRTTSSDGAPYLLELEQGRDIWEFPVAVWRAGRTPVPVSGASYWAVLPTAFVLRALGHTAPMAGLYLHPHEFDPQPLRAELARGAPAHQRAHARLRAAQRNGSRRRAGVVLRAIARRHRLITYGEAYAELSGDRGAGAQAFPHQGEGVR